MQALKLLFLFGFMVTNVTSFATINEVTDVQPKHFEHLETVYDDCNSVTYILQSQTESFPQLDTRVRLKPFSLRHFDFANWIRKQLGVNLQYLKRRFTIDLKLASHSISYPFHSFP